VRDFRAIRTGPYRLTPLSQGSRSIRACARNPEDQLLTGFVTDGTGNAVAYMSCCENDIGLNGVTCDDVNLEASSGQVVRRHRLNRSGDRRAKRGPLSHREPTTDSRTRDYMALATPKGKFKREIVRGLKR
jgi:hypothetical protein